MKVEKGNLIIAKQTVNRTKPAVHKNKIGRRFMKKRKYVLTRKVLNFDNYI